MLHSFPPWSPAASGSSPWPAQHPAPPATWPPAAPATWPTASASSATWPSADGQPATWPAAGAGGPSWSATAPPPSRRWWSAGSPRLWAQSVRFVFFFQPLSPFACSTGQVCVARRSQFEANPVGEQACQNAPETPTARSLWTDAHGGDGQV